MLGGADRARPPRRAAGAARADCCAASCTPWTAPTAQDRPYTVTESVCRRAGGVADRLGDAEPPGAANRSSSPFGLGQRTTQWERGDRPDDPVRVHRRPDAYGLATRTAHGRRAAASRPAGHRSPPPAEPYLATTRDHRVCPARRRRALPGRPGRPARPATRSSTTARPSVFELRDAVLAGRPAGNAVSLRVIGHSRTFYDGDAFVGLPLGRARRPRPGRPRRVAGLRPTTSSTSSSTRPIRRRSARGLPTSTRPARRLGRGVSRRVPCLTARAGRLRALRRRRRARVARRLLHRRRPAPLRRPRPGTGCRAACRSARSTRSAPKPASATTSTTCSRRAAVDPAGLDTVADHDLRRPAAAPGHRPQRQHQPGHVLPAGFVTAQLRARQGRRGRRHASPSVRMDYDLLAFAERGQPVSVTHVARVHHDTDTDVPADAARRRDRVGRVLRRVRPRCCRPGPRPRTSCSATPCSAAGCSRPTRPTRSATTVGRARQPGDPDNVSSAAGRSTTTRAESSRSTSRSSPPATTTPHRSTPSSARRRRSSTTRAARPIRTVNPDGSEQRRRPRRAGRPRRSRRVRADPVGVLHLRRQRQRRPHPRRGRRALPRPLEHPGQHRGRRPGPRRHRRRPQRPRPRHRLVRHPLDLRHPGQPDRPHRRPRPRGVPLPLRPGRAPLADGQHRRRPPRHRLRRRSAAPSRAGTARARSPSAPSTCCTGRSGCGPATTRAEPVTLRQRIDYGDGGDPDQPAADRAAARAHNLLGRPVAHYDEAGLRHRRRRRLQGQRRSTPPARSSPTPRSSPPTTGPPPTAGR